MVELLFSLFNYEEQVEQLTSSPLALVITWRAESVSVLATAAASFSGGRSRLTRQVTRD